MHVLCVCGWGVMVGAMAGAMVDMMSTVDGQCGRQRGAW